MIDATDTYTATFDAFDRARRGDPRWLRHVRREAFDRFQTTGFPTTRQEEWRFTNVAPIVTTAFQLPLDGTRGVDPARLATFRFAEAGWTELVFINGRYAPGLSRAAALPAGVQVRSMAEAFATDGLVLESHLARYTSGGEHAFSALNTAFALDGAVIYIPAGVEVPGPIHLLFYSAAALAATVSYPRVLIVAEANSRARIIESYAGASGAPYFTNAVTEVTVGPGASVDHSRLQRETTAAFHVGRTEVRLARDSRFTSHAISIGGALARNEINAVMDGEGVDCTLNGVYLANGDRLVDNHTAIDHAKPHCSSHEVYKGILAGRARGVFSGKILVRPDAQKTDAKQTNKVLLLSDAAQIDTKPQLEIFADDVKCTHGAAVGQLDEEALFYLRTRGIDPVAARSLLIYAFASDIVSRIALEPLRREIDRVLRAELAGAIDA